jgi:hypothetical protein
MKYGDRHDDLMKQASIVFHFSEKLHALPFFLCYEFNSVHVNLRILKGIGQIYFVIIIIPVSL